MKPEFFLAVVMVIFREVLDRAQGQRRQVARRHVVVGIGQSVDVGEMAALQSDFLGLLIHLLNKSLGTAAETFCQHDTGVIAR